MTKKTIVMLRICEDLKKSLKIRSVKEGVTMSALVMKLIEEYLAKNP